MTRKQRVLFFCKHNSCRSQMAEGLLRHMAGDRFDIYSAGLYPAPIHPLVYTVMEEIGINISSQAPKSVDLYLGRQPFDYIIIVCQESESECPRLYPFALHVKRWPLPDPAAVRGDPIEIADAFRNSRDTLEMKIEEWLSTIGPTDLSKE
ncbi:MAG TPA: arsenate reductase ArsC [Anaerohalosphaeraceae bacterium]|nr:arsenate reductase ArsC [Anaerohalosphaeraceae bacterium]